MLGEKMALFQWNNSYSVSNEEIDTQHQKLFAIINKLAESMGMGQGRKALGKIINELNDYTVIHFGTEEKIFDIVNYPEAASHKKEHAEFVRKVSEFKEEFEQGTLCLTVVVLNFLCDWLKDHIKKCDKQYISYLNS